MRVMCINDNWDKPDSRNAHIPRPVFGKDYNVLCIMSAFGDEYYKLTEYGDAFAYLTSHFAILPDQPEEELEQLEEKLEPELVEA